MQYFEILQYFCYFEIIFEILLIFCNTFCNTLKVLQYFWEYFFILQYFLKYLEIFAMNIAILWDFAILNTLRFCNTKVLQYFAILLQYNTFEPSLAIGRNQERRKRLSLTTYFLFPSNSPNKHLSSLYPQSVRLMRYLKFLLCYYLHYMKDRKRLLQRREDRYIVQNVALIHWK